MAKNKILKRDAEIARLKAENAFLRAQISTRAANPAHTETSYLRYLWTSAKEHSAYKAAKKLAGYFSKFRLISFILKALSYVAVVLETGVSLFAATFISAILLPPALITLPLIFICAALRFRRDDRRVQASIGDKRAIIIFLDKQYPFGSDTFCYRSARELLHRGYAVIAVSPFLLSTKGLCNRKKPYLNCRIEENGILLIRRQYFFHFKKNFSGPTDQKIILVY